MQNLMRGPWFMAIVVAMLLSPACQPDGRCDVGYEFVEGQCLRAKALIMDAAPTEGGANDGGAADSAITFGTPCRDGLAHSDCQGAVTTVCLIQPGQTEGQCSAVGCNSNPSLCPVGWSCFDLSVLQAGAPFGCVPF